MQQFPVLRRVYGQLRSRHVSLGAPHYIVPSNSPETAVQEIASLQRKLGTGSAAISGLDQLLNVINAGDAGLLHFACHNTFRADDGGSSITMDGEQFVPSLLNRAVTTRALASRSPLVFVNACRSAASVPEYTRMIGWAGQFMAAGAGAFVGTLWAVGSAAACAFAGKFYDALLRGETLGRAAHEARSATAEDSDDPTWLAYAIYGNPAATASADLI